ncbi:MAG: MATE family efflux transporter [Labilithrix sp.]|nr:MATE family efflux transporter [Labilithrix sp.]MCW5814636.1 MATE family efflux transporter [Labilithrix sp.]
MSDLAREVRRLALPAILHSLLQTLVFVVDRVMLGRHGDASLAAMQIGGTFEWSIWSVFAAFEVGTIARIGRHVGAGDRAAARRVAWLSIVIAVALGFVLTAATPLVLGAIPLSGAKLSPAALAEARGYLGVTIAASPLVFLSTATIAILQAGGDTRTPLLIGVGANVVHLALNRVLILGFGAIPALGARGAGISLAVTFAIEGAAAMIVLASPARPVSLRRSSANEPSLTAREEVRTLFRVGGPAFVERVLYHVGFITYALMVTRLGDAAMAANQSLISVESICFLSADGFGVAAATLVAQKLGAGARAEARAAAMIATRYAIAALTAFGVASFALRDVVLPLFSQDAEVVAIGRRTIPILTLAQPFMATSLVLAQALRGAGRTREALGVSLAGAVFVRITATWLFTFALGLGLVGVWIGSTVDWLTRAIVLFVMQRREAQDG